MFSSQVSPTLRTTVCSVLLTFDVQDFSSTCLSFGNEVSLRRLTIGLVLVQESKCNIQVLNLRIQRSIYFRALLTPGIIC